MDPTVRVRVRNEDGLRELTTSEAKSFPADAIKIDKNNYFQVHPHLE